MYCPTCGQQQINDEIRFCSRCGFLLSDVAEVVANKGISPYKTPSRLSKKDTLRKRGIKQGAMVMLVGIFLTALISVLMPFVGFSPVFIPLSAVIGFMGGLLRIIYAFMFESNDPADVTIQTIPTLPNSYPNPKSLSESHSIPADEYMAPAQGRWMETNDLAQPPSVTDNTTKLLQKEEKP
jgi:hypothetical protein